ncbi:MAG: hypothetical protein MnENMB40S_22330 [Rhizobiaceae bacterium MnEN-MB40S]|nr:MAG: hypothetical protein MnENMB40S_22330 [Rhizobiaceae bacterium MnEN-MB40S]
MSRILGIVLVLAITTAGAQSNNRPKLDNSGKYAGNYICLPKALGGVRWDEKTKEWKGTAFRTPSDDHFVLKITVDKKMKWKAFGFSMEGIAYLANVLPIEDNEVSCWGERNGYQPAELVGFGHIFMSPEGQFRCNTFGGLNYYTVNLQTRRYTRTYHSGFIDGEDSATNMPAVEVGICRNLD